ncbi:isopeptide-forming domain-containing fimbrial protein [Enterococcus sp. LJL90]
MRKSSGKLRLLKRFLFLLGVLLLSILVTKSTIVSAATVSTRNILSQIQPLAFPPGTATNSQTVMTADQFTQAYNDDTVDEIILGATITPSNSTHMRSKSLVIKGQDNQLNLNGSSVLQVNNDSGSNEVFTLMDIEYYPNTSSTTHFIKATGTNNATWEFNFSNIIKSDLTIRDRPLLSAVGATVNIYGTNNWLSNQTVGFIEAKNLNVYGSIRFVSLNNTSATPYLFVNSINGGQVNFNSGSQLVETNVTNGTIVYNTGENLAVNIAGADFDFTGINQVFYSTKSMAVTVADSTISGEKVNGLVVGDSTLNMQMTNTNIDVTEIGNIETSSAVDSVVTGTFTNSKISTDSLTGPIVSGGKLQTTFTGAAITLLDYQSNVIALNSSLTHTELSPDATTGSIIDFVDSILNITQSTSSLPEAANGNIELGIYVASDNVIHLNSQADVTFDNTNVDGNIIDKFLLAEGFNSENSSLTVSNGSKMNIYSQQDKVIAAGDIWGLTEDDYQMATFSLNLSDIGTEMNLSGNSVAGGPRGGLVSLLGNGSTYNVTQGAILNIHSLSQNPVGDPIMGGATPCITIQSPGGGFYLSEGGEVNLKQEGNANRYSAAIRFRMSGDMTFDISGNSKMTIEKYDGIASAVRMGGSNNHIEVSTGSDFTVLNKGSVEAGVQDGMVKFQEDSGLANENGLNQGIEFVPATAGGLNENTSFTVKGANSNISVTAELGVAFDGGRNPLQITASDDAYFVARGQTKSQSEGIFQGSELNIELNGARYFDFANTRPDGGRLFSMNGDTTAISQSVFDVKRSNLMIWKIVDGVDIFGDPDNSWPYLDFTLSGNGYQTLEAGHTGDADFVAAMGTTGMTTLTRMTANNQRAVIDDIRVATDADKYIYAHAQVPAGKGETATDATTGEVTIKVNILDENNIIVGTALGESIGTDLEVYGDTARAGMVKIELPAAYIATYGNFLSSKHTIAIDTAWRGPGGEGASTTVQSRDDDILVKTQEIEDVTPPETPTMTANFSMTNATKQLTGTLDDEDGTKVFIKINGTWLEKSAGVMASATLTNNQWTLDLPYYIDKDAEIEVYAKDQSSITGLEADQVPASYTTEPDGTYGNLSKDLDTYDAFTGYHDALDYTAEGGADERFQPALLLSLVRDVLPDQPTASKSVVSSGDSTTSVGDTLTYTTTLKNDKADTYETTWKDVKLVDVLDAGVDFDTSDTGIEVTVAGVPVANPVFTYDSSARELTIDVGDLDSQESATVTFKVTVNTAALGTEIKNTATGIGDGPQETPFVEGAENPNSDYLTYDAASNEVTNPGGVVLGAFDLRIEFQNEAGEEITAAIVATRNVGTIVNLTTDTELSGPITAKISEVEGNYYTLAKRPDNENSVEVELNGTTVVYQFNGMLTVASYAKTMSFGELAFNGKEQRVQNPIGDPTQNDLVIADTRAAATDGWTLLATLTERMATSGADNSYLNEKAVRYVTGEKVDGSIDEVTLNDSAQAVYSHVRTTGESGLFNVTNTWGSPVSTTKTGLNLVISQADVVGTYTGVITWTIQSGPA